MEPADTQVEKRSTMKIISNLLIIMLALIGIAEASFMTYQHYTNQIPPCSPGFQCEKVLTSSYATIGPIPISAIGMLFYSTMFALAIWSYLALPLPSILDIFRKRGFQPVDLLQLLSIVGILFSTYLVFVMGVIIEAWCTYCLLSALTSFLLFITTTWHGSLRRKGDSYVLKGWILLLGSKLYGFLLKPLFFRIDPEKIHNRMVRIGSLIGSIEFSRWLMRFFLGFFSTDSERKFAGVSFPNPIGLSAGYDYNGDLTQSLASVGFGWHTIGTITLEPYAGNYPPRLQRLTSSQALLVNKGLKNIGARAVIAKLSNQQFPIPVGVSIAATNKQYSSTKEQIMDIVRCFSLFENSRMNHAYYELNISCPNTFGGEPFTTCPRLEILLKAIDKLKLKKPVFVKLPIDQSEGETLDLLDSISTHQIEGVIFGNLTKDHQNPAVSQEDRKVWNFSKGNVSGRPTFERSNSLIALTKKHFGKRFVIVGTGGIFSAEDAKQKISLGADLVQLITGMIYEGPQLIGLINRELTYPDALAVAQGKAKPL